MTTDSASAGGSRKPSIYDVADRAGVSHMTVSRVLNGHPNIRASTRDKVMTAIDEMHYTRSSIARALATNRAMRIGVIVDNPGFYGPSSVLRAIEVAARQSGYAVSSFSVGDADGRRVDAGVVELVTQGVDALCVIAPRASSLDLLRQQAIALPTLVVKEEPDEQMHTASVDQRAGATAAVRHLIDLGHRTILHIAGPPDWFDAKARTEAWQAVLEEEGLPVVPPLIGDWSSDSGYAFGRELELGEATAVFVANDQMALGLMHGLAERGIRVPEDVSVVGFDDVPVAAHVAPTLTTVHQDFPELGRRAVKILLAQIRGEQVPAFGPLQTTLRLRESSGSR